MCATFAYISITYYLCSQVSMRLRLVVSARANRRPRTRYYTAHSRRVGQRATQAQGRRAAAYNDPTRCTRY